MSLKKKVLYNDNAKFMDCVFRKELFRYEYMCLHVHIYGIDLFKNMISQLGIGIATSIFVLMLIAFWKRALRIYIYIYIYGPDMHLHCEYVLCGNECTNVSNISIDLLQRGKLGM